MTIKPLMSGIKGERIMGNKSRELASAQLDLTDLLKDLNKAYCDEWLAYHAYKHMALVVGGPAYEDMEEFLNKTADLELEHAGELAARISELGGEPIANPSDFEKNANYPYPKIPKYTDDYQSIINMVLKAEAQAIGVYEDLVTKTMGKDNVTYQLVSHIQGEEVQHEERFENLLKSSNKENIGYGPKARTPEVAGVK
jgi:bacterioferritin